MKKSLSIILSIIMTLSVLSALPFNAFAEDKYNLWVGGTQVTSKNLSGNCDGGGTWSYSGNATEGTLTLTNAKINNAYTYTFFVDNNDNANIYSNIPKLTIVLSGENSLINKTSDNSLAIVCNDGCDLTVNGSGSLYTESTNIAVFISSGALNLSDCSVTCKSAGAQGVTAGGISMENSYLDVTNNGFYGVHGATISINGGGISSQSDNAAIYSNDSITVSGTGMKVIEPAGGKYDYGYVETSDGDLATKAVIGVPKTASVTVSPSESGTVSGTTYAQGFPATLTATAATDYHFVNWTENGNVVSTKATDSFNVTDSTALVANFALNEYLIVTTVNDAQGGTVTGGGDYSAGQTATLVATPNDGFVFDCWTVDDDAEWKNNNPELSVNVSGNRKYTALFRKVVIDEISEQKYTGSPIQPKPSVSLDGVDVVLLEGTDYELSYAYDLSAGKGTVTVNFIKDFSGTASADFNIVKQPLKIKAGSAERDYNGEALTCSDYTAEGLLGSDSISQITVEGEQTTVGYSANAVKNGSVEIVNGSDESVTGYYDITLEPGTLTVNARPITVTADDQTSTVGEALKELTYKLEGKPAEGDDLGITLSTNANKDKAGKYPITAKVSNANYKATTVDGVYTVKEKPVNPAPANSANPEDELNSGLKGVSNSKAVTVYWGRTTGAKYFEVYATYCGRNDFKKIATVNGNVTKYDITELLGKALNQKKNVKAYVVAYGDKGKLSRSLNLHVAGFKTKFSNVKKIKLKKNKLTIKAGKTKKIKGKIVLENKKKKPVNHVKKLRFKSSDESVATVTKSGKVKAKKKGTCWIYVYANNGMAKKVKITVK